MTNREFQDEVLVKLARLESHQEIQGKQLTQLFTFHNQNQKDIDLIQPHLEGHNKWRMAITVPIILAVGKVIWDTVISTIKKSN